MQRRKRRRRRLRSIFTGPYRSRLESKYAAYLEGLRLAGEVTRWAYEPKKFKLAERTTYTPDFEVVQGDTIYYVEVKGYHRNLSTSRVKWKCAAEKFNMYRWLWVTWDRNSGWCYEEYGA